MALYTCEKVAHRSEKEAKRVIKSIYKKRSYRLRAYLCDRCHKWHLTSEERFHDRATDRYRKMRRERWREKMEERY